MSNKKNRKRIKSTLPGAYANTARLLLLAYPDHPETRVAYMVKTYGHSPIDRQGRR